MSQRPCHACPSISFRERKKRGKRLFAYPPKEGVPGEDDDIIIEILAEIYGLVSGPPAWRQTLLTEFKRLDFRRHPLAPCVMLMYEGQAGSEQLTGLIVIETDDLLGGGIGSKWTNAIAQLRNTFKFGSWTWLREDASTA